LIIVKHTILHYQAVNYTHKKFYGTGHTMILLLKIKFEKEFFFHIMMTRQSLTEKIMRLEKPKGYPTHQTI
jgi:hypothetical protein